MVELESVSNPRAVGIPGHVLPFTDVNQVSVADLPEMFVHKRGINSEHQSCYNIAQLKKNSVADITYVSIRWVS